LARILPLEDALAPAIEVIGQGDVVAIPTETVYGLAADATNGEAVARIFEVKGRPRFNPLIVHVGSLDMAREIAVFDEISEQLAEKYWPGPLTLVLPLREGHRIHPLVTAGLETVAIRMPMGFGQLLITALGRPLAAPSANSSGRISPTSAQAVEDDLGARVQIIADGGRTQVGLESTIVKVGDGEVRMLRPGGITADEVSEFLGVDVVRGGSGSIEAPGMLASHYAPDASVRLDAHEVRDGEALMAFGPHRIGNAKAAIAILNLSPDANLREAAANLYAHLKALDGTGATTIAVEPIPHDGLGEAVRDRLVRAAAPRDGGSLIPQ
jgi:L-threonylcarbamoyladenylate synthase